MDGIRGSRLFHILNRSAAVVILASVIVLAALAFFLKKEDIAHTPISIGVLAFDSSRVQCILDSYGEVLRKQGSGEITWLYGDDSIDAEKCDFLLATSVQGYELTKTGRAECFLVAISNQQGDYPKGLLLARKDADPSNTEGRKLAFPSTQSASCYLSPLIAAKRDIENFSINRVEIEFTGCLACIEQLLYGVLFEEYFAAGIDQERYELLIAERMVQVGDLKVLASGIRVPEIVLMAVTPMSGARRKRMGSLFMGVQAEIPSSLERDLLRLGIAGFAECDREDLSKVEDMLSVSSELIVRYPP